MSRSLTHSNAKKLVRWVDSRIEGICVLGLLLAAIILFTINLGDLPLRDWDEGTVAQVAKEIASAPMASGKWLYPTLADQPYLNKPPLMHLLIASSYRISGISEWASRLPGAILTAVSVPLLYGIGREIFKSHTPAVYSALVYLTWLPVARHGRLAMLDGAVLCFSMLMIWCVLRSRRDLRYCLGIGIGLASIWLAKGMMGLLLGAIAIGFLAWDTPRLITSGYLWGGLLLGMMPVGAWYVAQWLHYGQEFLSIGIFGQSLQRIWTPVENHKGPPWYYLLEILKYGWPWLLFLPGGVKIAWENRNLSWAKLALVWGGGYLAAISLMSTKLPWYVLPIYPALALMVGAKLYEVGNNSPRSQLYPRTWIWGLGLLGSIALAGSLYFGGLGTEANWPLQLVLVAAAFTFLVAAVLVAQRNVQFVAILFWGTYVSLVLFMLSPHWIWELAEAYPVKPVAAIIQRHAPTERQVYTSFEYARPALNFYSDRQVIPATAAELTQHWEQDSQPYLLLDAQAMDQLNLKSVNRLGTAEGWTLVTRQPPLKQRSPAKE
jgi:4-amino-4-deoxy-L-arabinose transferase-like glycosyltransferase